MGQSVVVSDIYSVSELRPLLNPSAAKTYHTHRVEYMPAYWSEYYLDILNNFSTTGLLRQPLYDHMTTHAGHIGDHKTYRYSREELFLS